MLLVAEPSLGEDEKAALAEVVDSGWITMGDRVRSFERAFADEHCAADAVAVSSCTAGLHLAMQALEIGPGDEVLVPSLTFVATSFSGTFADGTNEYNGSNKYSYAAEHNPPVFFTTTNGGDNPTPTNPLAQNYAPLQQLQTDLANNTVANYNWITPNLYNDMHSPLPAGFTYNGTHLTGDAAQIAQGDNFLSKVVPMIEASQAYKNDGVVIIWWDETEGGDEPSHTIGEIVISPDAKGNAYTNHIRYTHSSDLLTIQKIFDVGPCLRDACSANDLNDLFVPGAIPNQISNNTGN